MSTPLEVIECPLSGRSICSYQELMIRVQFGPIDEMEVDIVEGSKNLSETLPKPSKSVQYVRSLGRNHCIHQC